MSVLDGGMIGPCDLHIPHKHWNDDWQEQANYAAIERWARRFRHCLGAGAPSIVPKQIHRVAFLDQTVDIPFGVGNGAYFPFNTLIHRNPINDNYTGLTTGIQFGSTGFAVWWGNVYFWQNTFSSHLDFSTHIVNWQTNEWREVEHQSGLTRQAAQTITFGGGMWVDAGEQLSIFLQHVTDPPISVTTKTCDIGIAQVEFN